MKNLLFLARGIVLVGGCLVSLHATPGDQEDINALKESAEGKGYKGYYGRKGNTIKDGYVFFHRADLMKGKKSLETLETVCRSNKNVDDFRKAAGDLARNNYKIHIMPGINFSEVFTMLDKALNDDQELRELICAIKVRQKDYREDSCTDKKIHPDIVIYLATGVTNAQRALNKIYNFFKDVPTSTATLANNHEIIPHLLYVAQGDSSDKRPSKSGKSHAQRIEETFGIKRVFSKDHHGAYFDPMISGTYKNYRLYHPAGKESRDFIRFE